ncbi:MAG TPA: hypothetical protein VK698_37115 [Kofleriaceae bacterium]|nr:hypothetical protein [Kofleriaceae bacterium]
MSMEHSASCRLLVSPLPVPIPGPLPVSVRAAERSVLLIDSRKPNSLRILEHAAELLRREGVEVAPIAKKKNPVNSEEEARHAEFARHRGLVLLGVFD